MFRSSLKLIAHPKTSRQILKDYQNLMQPLLDKRQKLLKNMADQGLQEKLQTVDSQVDSITLKMRKELRQNNQEYKTSIVRKYILENTPKFQEFDENLGKKVKEGFYIPNSLVLKKIIRTAKIHGAEKKKELLLIGVENDNEEHCIYVKKLLQELKIKKLLTMMPPDLPIFIKPEKSKSFLGQWIKFLKNPQYAKTTKFYLNVTPNNLNEICLHKEQINLVREGMTNCQDYYAGVYAMLRKTQKHFQCLPILSGFVANSVEDIYFCDYPVIKYRQKMAMEVSIQNARKMFHDFLSFMHQQSHHYSADLKLPKNLIQERFGHTVACIREIMFKHTAQNQRIALLCASDQIELFASAFEDKQISAQPLIFNLKKSEKQVSFIHFIQKLVIFDLILPGEPILHKYYIQYGSFPYLCDRTIGGLENLGKVHLAWEYYHKNYTRSLKNVLSVVEKSQVSNVNQLQ